MLILSSAPRKTTTRLLAAIPGRHSMNVSKSTQIKSVLLLLVLVFDLAILEHAQE